jgi:hypothetical protein
MRGAGFTELASLATEARYAGETVDTAQVDRARSGAVAVKEQVRATTTVPQRLGYQLSPRKLLRRRPGPSRLSRRR